MTTAPVICDLDSDGLADVLAISHSGAVMRFELSNRILPSAAIWPQAGFSGSRTFAYKGPSPVAVATPQSAITYFYNYPNPARAYPAEKTTFKYMFAGPAEKLKLDIYTYTGYHVFSESSPKLLSSYPGADEYELDLTKFGPGVYRCRFEAVVNGTKQVKYWKLAVVR
jgi:hypothetical protein